MNQFTNVVDKNMVLPLRKKRLRTLEEAATWVDGHVLAQREVPNIGRRGWYRNDKGLRTLP